MKSAHGGQFFECFKVEGITRGDHHTSVASCQRQQGMPKNGRGRKLHQQIDINRFLLDLDEIHSQFFGKRS